MRFFRPRLSTRYHARSKTVPLKKKQSDLFNETASSSEWILPLLTQSTPLKGRRRQNKKGEAVIPLLPSCACRRTRKPREENVFLVNTVVLVRCKHSFFSYLENLPFCWMDHLMKGTSPRQERIIYYEKGGPFAYPLAFQITKVQHWSFLNRNYLPLLPKCFHVFRFFWKNTFFYTLLRTLFWL